MHNILNIFASVFSLLGFIVFMFLSSTIFHLILHLFLRSLAIDYYSSSYQKIWDSKPLIFFANSENFHFFHRRSIIGVTSNFEMFKTSIFIKIVHMAIHNRQMCFILCVQDGSDCLHEKSSFLIYFFHFCDFVINFCLWKPKNSIKNLVGWLLFFFVFIYLILSDAYLYYYAHSLIVSVLLIPTFLFQLVKGFSLSLFSVSILNGLLF
jgi:hypothetical protein